MSDFQAANLQTPASPTRDPNDRLSSSLAALQRAIEVVDRLRSPEGGCPWDLAQTSESLAPYAIEEAYELVAALRDGNDRDVAEELGDVLLQVLLHARIAFEGDLFTLADVANGIADKLIRRHPHVFGELQANDSDEVRQHWERIKAEEKGETLAEADKLGRKFDRYARTLPPMVATMKISRKAAAVGFEWENIEGVWQKFEEEMAEFKHAVACETVERQQEEMGDVLFCALQLCRWYGLDPSKALQDTNYRFARRFGLLEDMAEKPLTEYAGDELEAFWQRAKAKIVAMKTATAPANPEEA